MKIAIASDHAGFDQKPAMIEYLQGLGHEVVDLGPASGIGMALTADKVAGIRAAVIQTPEFSHLFREHNDGNVVCISGRFTSLETNKKIVDEFLTTEFGGGRHAGRVEKIMREDDPTFSGVER